MAPPLVSIQWHFHVELWDVYAVRTLKSQQKLTLLGANSGTGTLLPAVWRLWFSSLAQSVCFQALSHHFFAPTPLNPLGLRH